MQASAEDGNRDGLKVHRDLGAIARRIDDDFTSGLQVGLGKNVEDDACHPLISPSLSPHGDGVCVVDERLKPRPLDIVEQTQRAGKIAAAPLP